MGQLERVLMQRSAAADRAEEGRQPACGPSDPGVSATQRKRRRQRALGEAADGASSGRSSGTQPDQGAGTTVRSSEPR